MGTMSGVLHQFYLVHCMFITVHPDLGDLSMHHEQAPPRPWTDNSGSATKGSSITFRSVMPWLCFNLASSVLSGGAWSEKVLEHPATPREYPTPSCDGHDDREKMTTTFNPKQDADHTDTALLQTPLPECGLWLIQRNNSKLKTKLIDPGI